MDANELRHIYNSLSFGYQATVQDQRWMWNSLVKLCFDDCLESPEIHAALRELGELPEMFKCKSCGGTGQWGEDYDWGLMHPLSCLACSGTGEVSKVQDG
jgi:hypothetical protein